MLTMEKETGSGKRAMGGSGFPIRSRPDALYFRQLGPTGDLFCILNHEIIIDIAENLAGQGKTSGKTLESRGLGSE